MSKIALSHATRVLLALGLYALLVVVSGVIFQWIRVGNDSNYSTRYFYSLGGSTLSVFTNMSYYLFALQSMLLIPWLLLGALYPRAIKLSVFAFFFTWLCIGWYMHHLFWANLLYKRTAAPPTALGCEFRRKPVHESGAWRSRNPPDVGPLFWLMPVHWGAG